MSEALVTVTERWIYLGRRYYGPKQGIVNLWEKPDGTEAAFVKFPAGAVGGIYEITVVKATDSDKVKGTPKWTQSSVDADRRAVLSAADQAAYAEKAAIDAEKRLSKSTDLDYAIQPLERLAAKCRSIAELDALQQVVRARLAKAKWNS